MYSEPTFISEKDNLQADPSSQNGSVEINFTYKKGKPSMTMAIQLYES